MTPAEAQALINFVNRANHSPVIAHEVPLFVGAMNFLTAVAAGQLTIGPVQQPAPAEPPAAPQPAPVDADKAH